MHNPGCSGGAASPGVSPAETLPLPAPLTQGITHEPHTLPCIPAGPSCSGIPICSHHEDVQTCKLLQWGPACQWDSGFPEFKVKPAAPESPEQAGTLHMLSSGSLPNTAPLPTLNLGHWRDLRHRRHQGSCRGCSCSAKLTQSPKIILQGRSDPINNWDFESSWARTQSNPVPLSLTGGTWTPTGVLFLQLFALPFLQNSTPAFCHLVGNPTHSFSSWATSPLFSCCFSLLAHQNVPSIGVSQPYGFPSCLPWTYGALTHSVNLFFPKGLFSLHEFNGLIIAIPLRKSCSLSRNPSHPGLNLPCTDFLGCQGIKVLSPSTCIPEYLMGTSTNPWLWACQRMGLITWAAPGWDFYALKVIIN